MTFDGGSGVFGDALLKSHRLEGENGLKDALNSDFIPPDVAEDGCPTGDLKGVKESSDSMDLEVCSESRDSSESSSCPDFSGTTGGATAGTRRHIISPDANLTINNFVVPSSSRIVTFDGRSRGLRGVKGKI